MEDSVCHAHDRNMGVLCFLSINTRQNIIVGFHDCHRYSNTTVFFLKRRFLGAGRVVEHNTRGAVLLGFLRLEVIATRGQWYDYNELTLRGGEGAVWLTAVRFVYQHKGPSHCFSTGLTVAGEVADKRVAIIGAVCGECNVRPKLVGVAEGASDQPAPHQKYEYSRHLSLDLFLQVRQQCINSSLIFICKFRIRAYTSACARLSVMA